jgi:tripartite-type tricarboxylate transporter receptor subunit TctC
MRARIAGWCLALVALLAGAVAAAADVYPARPIRIVAPSTPGDAPDVIARLLAERMTAALGTQVFVENHPGAGGVVGSEIVAKASADGYTLIIGNAGSHGINAAVYAKLRTTYRGFRRGVAGCGVAQHPGRDPDVPASNVQQFIAYAKARPGSSAMHPAATAAAHVSMELFKSMAGIDLVHIPYKAHRLR